MKPPVAGVVRLVAEKAMLETPLGVELAGRFQHKTTFEDRIRPADYAGFEAGDLVLSRHDGRFVKPCPGTRGYNCCGLEIIHFGLGCRLDCTYCILQGYLDTQALVLFGNVDQGLADLEAMLQEPGDRPRRFCTGEFTDSLLLEDLTGLGRRLVKLFAGSSHSLELKTKTVNIDGLLDLDHGGRTIISFSMNAPEIADREERRAPSLEKRLAAAARAAAAGYRLGFHFDPLIRHPGWRDGYARAVEGIFSAVPADRVAWISLGAFRYLPKLKSVIRRRHPQTRIMDEEFVLAADGKMRYLRPIRVEMYRRMVTLIRETAPQVRVYLCMESPRVWRETFGYDPGDEGLIRMLDERVLEKMNDGRSLRPVI